MRLLLIALVLLGAIRSFGCNWNNDCPYPAVCVLPQNSQSGGVCIRVNQPQPVVRPDISIFGLPGGPNPATGNVWGN